MKVLEITPEIEHALVQVLDSALKASGMAILLHVEKIKNAIQAKTEETQK